MQHRDSFDAQFKFDVIRVPTMNQLVECTEQSLNPYLEKVIAQFSSYGFAVVEFNEITPEEMPLLKNIFGSNSPHQKQYPDGRLLVDPSIPTSIGVATVDEIHRPHTDETYMPKPSKIIGLLCEIPAASGGGISTITSGVAMYNHIKTHFPEKLSELFRPDVLSVRRSLLGTGYKEEQDLLAIFTTQNNGRISLRWRSNDSYVEKVHEEAKSGWLSLCDFVLDEKYILKHYLKKNQLLLLDNSGVVHGRTIYEKGERRRLWRMNFYNDGILQDKIVLGLDPEKEIQG